MPVKVVTATSRTAGARMARGSGLALSEGTPREAYATGSVDGSTSAAARPRGVRQEAGIEVYVDGALVPLRHLIGGITVDRSIDQPLQRWSFGVLFATAVSLWGSPWARVGPSLGRRSIDLVGVYRTATGVHRFPLITDGVCDNMQCVSSKEGTLAVFNGVDRGGRRDRRAITKIIPAGAGLTRGRVVQLLLAEAGETAFRLEPGSTVYKEVQAVDTSAVRLAQEMLDAEGRRLLWNREGFAVNPRIGRREGRPLKVALEPRDLLYIGTVEVGHSGDVVTDVTLTGTEQVVRDAEAAQGRTSKVNEVEIQAIYAPAVASYRQNNTTGALTPQLGPGAAKLRPVSLVRNIVETSGGVVVTEIEEVYGYHWVEGPRYVYGAAGARYPLTAYLGEDGTEGGSEPAYVEMFERWRLISRKVTRHYYAQDGYFGPASQVGRTYEPWGSRLAGGTENSAPTGVVMPGTEGYKLGSVTDYFSWGMARRALKERDAGVSWEEIDPRDGVRVNGAGEGVVSEGEPGVSGDGESFRLSGREVEIIEAVPVTGYITSTTVYSLGFSLRPGTAYWYAGGDESAQEREVFQLKGWTTTAYTMPEESGHTSIATEWVFDGRPQVVGSRTERKDGAAPAVARIPQPGNSEGLYESEDVAARAMTARSTESRQIKVRLYCPDLEISHEKKEVKTSVPWAETPEELALLCALLVEQSAAAPVGFVTAANYTVAEADWVHLYFPPLALDHDLEIQSVQHGVEGLQGPRVTTFTANAYPEVVYGE